MFGIDFNSFLVSVGPIAAMLVSAGFAYLGVMVSNKAKAKDQQLANRVQEYEGIKTGQQFMKDALDEAKKQIIELRRENEDLNTALDKLEKLNDELHAQNLQLQALAHTLEKKIGDMEISIQELRDQMK